jgi:hypothetical protein
MSDDVETILAGLERRLQALQAELGEEPPSPPPPPPRQAESVDALDRFGDQLRDLVSAYDRALAESRGVEGFTLRGDVALDVVTDFTGLCALRSGLRAIPGVASFDLRAYAGGRAAIDLVLDRPVAVVEQLRRTLRTSISVLEAREGRLSIELGTVARGAPRP